MAAFLEPKLFDNYILQKYFIKVNGKYMLSTDDPVTPSNMYVSNNAPQLPRQSRKAQKPKPVSKVLPTIREETTEELIQEPTEEFIEELTDERITWRPVPMKLLYFSMFTGMPIVQYNGQRFYGPPRDYTGPLPQRGSEVFVGAIPRDADEMELVPIFGSVGRIYRIRLMMDFSGTNRGFCFVQYFTPTEASSAISKLKKFEIRPGRRIGVFRSVENSRLQINGLSAGISAKEIYNKLSTLVEGVINVSLVKWSWTKYTKGLTNHAIVQYESHREAAVARRILISGRYKIKSCPIIAEWAIPPKTL